MMVSVPHQSQRYETVGDYQDAHGTTLITVSEMSDARYEQLVAVHELIEQLLVTHRGIELSAIDHFDQEFEKARQIGDDREPGDQPEAPYHREHVFATNVERLLAAELGVDWDTYDKEVLGLSQV